MKKRTLTRLALVLALLAFFAAAAFAAEDVRVALDDKLSFRGINANVSDGVLDLELTGKNDKNDPRPSSSRALILTRAFTAT